MAKYLLIESRDPFDSTEVTVFLVQNGVLPARQGAEPALLDELRAAGVEVLADEFSLAERGITRDRLSGSVTAVGLAAVIQRLVEGRTTLWH